MITKLHKAYTEIEMSLRTKKQQDLTTFKWKCQFHFENAKTETKLRMSLRNWNIKLPLTLKRDTNLRLNWI